MNTQTAYITIAILALAIVAILVFVFGRNRQKNRLTPLASLAFGFVTAGIIFNNDRLISYGLMGVGIILAVVDIFKSKRK